MTKTLLFIFGSLSFLLGVFLYNSFFGLVFPGIVGVIFLCLFFFFLFKEGKKDVGHRRNSFLFFVILICFIFGVFRSFLHTEKLIENLKFLATFPKKTHLELQIEKLKTITDEHQIYIGKLEKIGSKEAPKSISFEIFIRSNYRLKKGDHIRFETKRYSYKNSEDFAYKTYMLSQNIYEKVYPYNYDTFGKRTISTLEKNIIKLRESLLDIIDKIYTKEEGIFLGGILLGARESLPKELKTNFNNSGLTHFIAVSGFNITILVLFFHLFIKFLPNILRIGIIIVAISLFSYLVGLTAPVIRASIMGIVGYIVLTMGRRGHNLAIILFTAVIMVGISPLSLNYDVSLHLSFFAVLGIVYTEKWFEKVFSFVPKTLEIRTALSITCAALVFTLPVMIFNFGQISILAPIANVLVTWTIPLAMLFGFLSLVAYSIAPLFGIILGFVPWLLLKWDILVVNTFGTSRWALFEYNFGPYKFYFEVIYILILFFVTLWFHKKREK